jgi:hypothetical protein
MIEENLELPFANANCNALYTKIIAFRLVSPYIPTPASVAEQISKRESSFPRSRLLEAKRQYK